MGNGSEEETWSRQFRAKGGSGHHPSVRCAPMQKDRRTNQAREARRFHPRQQARRYQVDSRNISAWLTAISRTRTSASISWNGFRVGASSLTSGLRFKGGGSRTRPRPSVA